MQTDRKVGSKTNENPDPIFPVSILQLLDCFNLLIDLAQKDPLVSMKPRFLFLLYIPQGRLLWTHNFKLLYWRPFCFTLPKKQPHT
jgi:hypothetical protein